MDYNKLKQTIEDGKGSDLTGPYKIFAQFINKELEQEEALSLLDNETDIDAFSLLGKDTQDLVVAIAIDNENLDLAIELIKSPIVEEFNKEEIAFQLLSFNLPSTNKFKEFCFELNKQGLLTKKEIEKYQLTDIDKDVSLFDNEKIIESIKNNNFQLENISLLVDNKNFNSEHLNLLIQNNKINVKFIDVMIVSRPELLNPENVLLLLSNHELIDIQNNDLLFSIVEHKNYNFQLLSNHIKNNIISYLIMKKKIKIIVSSKKSEITLDCFQKDLISSLSEGEVAYVDYLSSDNKKYLEFIWAKYNNEDEVVIGHYNFYKEEFVTKEKTVINIPLSLVQINDDGLKKYIINNKPNFEILGILKKYKKSFLIKIDFNEILIDSELDLQIKMLIERYHSNQNIQISNRKFGVELEICMNNVMPSDLALMLEAEDNYEKDTADYSKWSIKEDTSIKHLNKKGIKINDIDKMKMQKFEAEIVTSKLQGIEGLQELESKLKSLKNEFGEDVFVNTSCGLHVHHDISSFCDKKILNPKIEEKFINELMKIQDIIYLYISPERRNNKHCPKIGIKEQSNRPGFNLKTGKGTIEFRMHEATLDPQEILNWVQITQKIVDNIINSIEKTDNTETIENILENLLINKIYKTLNSNQNIKNELNGFLHEFYLKKLLLK